MSVHSERSLEGYLLIDMGASPGVPESLIRASGLMCPIVGKGEKYESATRRCSHCHAIVILSPRRTDSQRNKCSRCRRYVCHRPECNKDCKPLDDVMEGMMNMAVKLSTT